MNRCTKCGHHNHSRAKRCSVCRAEPVRVNLLAGPVVVWKKPLSVAANQPVGWNGQ